MPRCDKRIARVLPRGNAAENEAFGQLPRNVLHRVDREIRAFIEERLLDFFDEEAFAANLGERAILNAVPARDDAELAGLEARLGGAQARDESPALREREHRAPGGINQWAGGHLPGGEPTGLESQAPRAACGERACGHNGQPAVFCRVPRDRFGVVFLAVVTAALCGLARPAEAKPAASTPDPMSIEVPGFSDAYYYKPRTKSSRPIILYLHGRGGNAFEDCRKWARVAQMFGWVVCPQGPAPTDSGGRTWNNDADAAKRIVDATVAALKDKYKRRVRTRGDILIGFSEGAFVAQQVGLRDPTHWNKWLILAANDRYWFGDCAQLLEQNRAKIRRVFLFTGENDQVADNTKRAGDMLREAHIRVKVKIVPGLGHEVPADQMITNYRRPLRWLVAAK